MVLIQVQGRACITGEDTRNIYRVKRRGKAPSDAARLSAQYGITTKAVRDIWRHHTWGRATVALWSPRDVKNPLGKRRCASSARCHVAGVQVENALLPGVPDDTKEAATPPATCTQHNMPARTDFHGREAELNPQISSSLPRRMDLMWRNANARLGGLMDEALGIV